ncbi:MAG: hypothetical protein Q9159_000341 [Coniocarpon cinnabarinum]
MKWKIKAAVSVLMSLGFLTAAAALVRTIQLAKVKGSDFTYELVWLTMWTWLEAAIAAIVANMPTIKPLFSRHPSRRTTPQEVQSSERIKSSGKAASHKQSTQSSQRFLGKNSRLDDEYEASLMPLSPLRYPPISRPMNVHHTYSDMAIGFIGLGVMGYPMVSNLVQKLSTQVHVFDVQREACERIKDAGGSKINDVVLTMLPEGTHVRSVYLDTADSIIEADLTHKLLIDCSTIDTATSLSVKELLASTCSSCSFVDAPVSGGVLGAEKATMTFMVGCAQSSPLLPRVRELLLLMGGNVIACGGPSLGLTAKLCNNYCSGLIAIATSEAMNIGIRSGMDPRVLSDVFKVSLAGSTINEKWNPCPGVVPDAPASNGYKPGFRLELMRKDFNLAVETAKRVDANLALGEAGLSVYSQAMTDDRCKGLDSRVVYRYLNGEEDWKAKLGLRDDHHPQ